MRRHASYLRRATLASIAVAMLVGISGCNSNSNIPLVEFPQGAPPPPAPAKSSGLSQGSATSQGEPSH